MPEIPKRQFPMRQQTDGRFAQVEQDSLDDVRKCVHVLLRTPLGARPLAPEVGVEDPTFSLAIDTEVLAARLADDDMEPRADVTVTASGIDAGGELQLTVEVGLAGEPTEEDR